MVPGVVLSEMGLTLREEVRERMLENIPLPRLSEPEEVADMAIFLRSDLASHATGHVIRVNGRWYG